MDAKANTIFTRSLFESCLTFELKMGVNLVPQLSHAIATEAFAEAELLLAEWFLSSNLWFTEELALPIEKGWLPRR